MNQHVRVHISYMVASAAHIPGLPIAVQVNKSAEDTSMSEGLTTSTAFVLKRYHWVTLLSGKAQEIREEKSTPCSARFCQGPNTKGTKPPSGEQSANPTAQSSLLPRP